MTEWTMNKFGGTSLADADCFRKIPGILGPHRAHVGIVVSAMGGVTNRLIAVLDAARDQDPSYREKLQAIAEIHKKTIADIAPSGGLEGDLESDMEDLSDILRAVWLGRSYGEPTLELVSGYGELWSARMLASFLGTLGMDAAFLDARKVLIVDEAGRVDWEESQRRLSLWRLENPGNPVVITGYIASLANGVQTTLKRNGSDFSASIFANLFDARSLTIWTDADRAVVSAATSPASARRIQSSG